MPREREKRPLTYGFGGANTMVGGVLSDQTTGSVRDRDRQGGVIDRRSPNVTNPENKSRASGGYAPGYRPGTYVPRTARKPKNNFYNPMPHPGLYNQDLGFGGDPFADAPDMFSPGAAPELSSLSFGDFLAQARELVGDAGLSEALSIIAGREGNLKNTADQNRARLQAMYRQLGDSVRADAGGIRENAAAAREAYNSIGAGEQSAAQAAYENTQKAQQEMRARLGIEDAAIYDIATGDQQAQQYQGDVSRSTARTANAQTQATANEQAALDRNTGDVAAVGLEGNSRVADLDQQLASLLAELQDEQSAARMEYTNRANSSALDLANSLFNSAGDQQDAAYSRWLDQQRLQQDASNNAYQRWLDRENLERQDAQTAWQQGFDETRFAADLMGQQQPQQPDIDFGPMELFTQQLDRMLGPKAGAAANTIAAATRYRSNNPGLGSNPQQLIEDLISQGLTPQEATWAVNAYLGAVGG